MGPWVASSDELFSLRVPGSLIRILLLMVITAASHAMCDAELASDWSGLPGHGLGLAGDMLHDARQILSPPGNDRVGVGCAPGHLTCDTHRHTPETHNQWSLDWIMQGARPRVLANQITGMITVNQSDETSHRQAFKSETRC